MINLNTARVTATPALHAWATTHPDRCTWLVECLDRHHRDDWGDLDDHDHAANVSAVVNADGRIVSNYPLPDHLTGASPDSTVWIITDQDEAPVITVLWPSDY